MCAVLTPGWWLLPVAITAVTLVVTMREYRAAAEPDQPKTLLCSVPVLLFWCLLLASHLVYS